ncbi:MAG: hypothetical protein ACK41P_09430 [Asticcacaulis sp.]
MIKTTFYTGAGLVALAFAGAISAQAATQPSTTKPAAKPFVCPIEALDALSRKPLPAKPSRTFAVTTVITSEGGEWRVYNTKAGLAHLVRVDGGEGGMMETQLSVISPRAYVIRETSISYLRHAFLEGPNADAKEVTTRYFFCDGKVYQPGNGAAILGDDYVTDGHGAQTRMLDDKDTKALTRPLKR